jgi:hypothetical protein
MQLHKLGKHAPKFDRRTLMLDRYTKALPPPPPQAYYQTKVSAWGMLMNDTLGDCVPAASGHMIEQWTTYTLKPVPVTDEEILIAYEDIGGYVPGDPSTDNGCNMLDALNYWRKTGIAGHKISVYAGINLQGGELAVRNLKYSVSLFGNCYLGLALPISAQGQTGWHVDDSDPTSAQAGSWGGHCVPIVGYSPKSITVVTWGSILNMSWNFFQRYADEAYCVLSQDWIETNGLAPSGFDFNALDADLKGIN